jgi:hypothetical protein
MVFSLGAMRTQLPTVLCNPMSRTAPQVRAASVLVAQKGRLASVADEQQVPLADTGAAAETQSAQERAVGLQRDPAVRRFLQRRQAALFEPVVEGRLIRYT